MAHSMLVSECYEERRIRIETFLPTAAEVATYVEEHQAAFAYGDPESTRWRHLQHHFHARRLCALHGLGPEFGLCARDDDNRLLATLRAVPAYWDGNPQSLGYFEDYERLSPWLMKELGSWRYLLLAGAGPRTLGFMPRPIRQVRDTVMGRANAFILLELLVFRSSSGRRIPSLFIDQSKRLARQLGFEWLLSPFRPSEYGAWKLAGRRGSDAEGFAAYCGQQDDAGLPTDRWLRCLVRNGMRMLRPEPSCHVVPVRWGDFERFRQRHRRDDWYQPSRAYWECGETHSWWVNPVLRTVRAVEPNVWGMIPLDETTPPPPRDGRGGSRSPSLGA